MSLAWCIVMSDSRPFNETGTEDWQMAARINRNYALSQGYGFLYAQVGVGTKWDGPAKATPACVHPERGARVAAWCKVPVVAKVLLHGIDGRRCEQVMYADADAIVTNRSMSIDAYLERARAIGDEALLEPTPYSLLFSSNYWWKPNGPCSGLFWVRNDADACGMLRRWWDAKFDSHNTAHPWEQAPLEAAYIHKRAFGARLRVMPTARNWHASDLPSKPTEPHDVFTIHGLKSKYGYGSVLLHNLQASLAEPRAAGGGVASTLSLDDAFAARLFDGVATPRLSERCPLAAARPGAEGFDDEARCCGGEPMRPSLTNLDGSAASSPRKCWSPSYDQASWDVDAHASCAPNCEQWSCWRAHADDVRRREADVAALPALSRTAWTSVYGAEPHAVAARSALKQLVDDCWCGMGNALVMDVSSRFAPPPGKTETGLPNPVGLWNPNYFPNPTSYAAHWRSVAPRLEDHLEMAYALRASPAYANTTAVHVRCSDVPFKKMPWYHVQQASYWSFAVRKLREAKAPRAVRLFNSSAWMQSDEAQRGACDEYAAAVGAFFSQHGFDVTFAAATMGEEETFEAFLGSAALVAATPSSFSFLPGVALSLRGDTYITPLFYTETAALHEWYDKQRARRGLTRNATVPNVGVELQRSSHAATHAGLPGLVPWQMYRRPPVLHAAVTDYVSVLRGYAERLAASSGAAAGQRAQRQS